MWSSLVVIFETSTLREPCEELNIGQATNVFALHSRLSSDPLWKKPTKTMSLHCGTQEYLNLAENLIFKLVSELDNFSITGNTMDNDTDLDIEEQWISMPQFLQSSCKEVLGFSKRMTPDWSNKSAGEILSLLQSQNAAFQAHLTHPTSAVYLQKWKEVCSNTEHRVREIQNDWWIHEIQYIQHYTDENKTWIV